jgi:hypothetical protein
MKIRKRSMRVSAEVNVVISKDIKTDSIMVMRKRKIQKNIRTICKVMINEYGKNERYCLSKVKVYNGRVW